MMCHRCLKQMRADEAETVVIDSPSGPGTTIHVHRRACRAARQQTSPSGRGR